MPPCAGCSRESIGYIRDEHQSFHHPKPVFLPYCKSCGDVQWERLYPRPNPA